MVWYKWVLLILGVYLLGYSLVTVFLRAKDINNNRKSTADTYGNGLLWPFAVFYIPYGIIEGSSQLVAKYMGYRDRKYRQKKFDSVA